jgi:hypothetical protein
MAMAAPTQIFNMVTIGALLEVRVAIAERVGWILGLRRATAGRVIPSLCVSSDTQLLDAALHLNLRK